MRGTAHRSACRCGPILSDLQHVDMRDKVIWVGAREYNYVIAITLIKQLNQGHEIRDQRGTEQIHWRTIYFRKEHGAFGTRVKRLEVGHRKLLVVQLVFR